MRTGKQSFLRFRQPTHGLLSGDGWEINQELVEGLPGFRVVQKSLDGNPCTDKDKHPAKDLRVPGRVM